MGWFAKASLGIILAAIAVAGIAIPLYKFATLAIAPGQQRMTDLESFMFAILLTITSTFVSWLISRHYAKEESKSAATTLIDNIGEQSAEKSLNQSRQLWDIEQFISSKRDDVLSMVDKVGPSLVLDFVIQLIRTIRSSNSVLVNDWAGVTSPKVAEKIRQRGDRQTQLFEEYEAFARGEVQDEGAREDLASRAKELPGHIAPSFGAGAVRVVHTVRQTALDATATKNVGELEVVIARPIYNYTASGKLIPVFNAIPSQRHVETLSYPDGAPEFAVLLSVGTNFDFNVHVKSERWGELLPAGRYKFSYRLEE